MKNLHITKLTAGTIALCATLTTNSIRADDYAKMLLQEYQPTSEWLEVATQYLIYIGSLTDATRHWILYKNGALPNYDFPEIQDPIIWPQERDQQRLFIGVINYGQNWMNPQSENFEEKMNSFMH